MELGVSCRKDSAKITFNLDNLNSQNWLDGLTVMVTFTNRTEENSFPLPSLDLHELTISDLKPGSKYDFCLKFMADTDGHLGEVAGFCKVNKCTYKVIQSHSERFSK